MAETRPIAQSAVSLDDVNLAGATLRQRCYVPLIVSSPLTTLSSEALQIARRLFALPEDVKKACEAREDERFQHGWGRMRDELEVWHVSAREPFRRFPSEIADASELLGTLITEAIHRVLPVLCEATFPSGNRRAITDLITAVRDGDSLLNILYYPPGRASFKPHVDLGIASLFIIESPAGLEVLDDTKWVQAEYGPGMWILAAGEMLGKKAGIRPLMHRVKPPNMQRFSLTIFLHVHPDYVLACGADGTPLTAGMFSRKQRY